ncbi:MAG TPA: NUDIX domain-containing protein [Pirellulales bacterium]|nr:NUDIX domain-containing protein [Pirellulales bacterium]
MLQSAGTLLYRRTAEGVEVLLVHPSGNYNRHAPWGIPKGVPDEGEALEAAARRETREETGIEAPATLQSLGSITYKKSRKLVHAFAGEAKATDATSPQSWEVDRAEFVPLAEARRIIHPDQAAFLDALEALIAT